MSGVDWLVLFVTLGAIVGYGLWKTRAGSDMAGYLHGGYRDSWRTIGLSVMATQASAITFLSTPGQAYEDGMRFVQFYFGLPLAMVVLSVAFVPRFYRLRVYTAYEYLEGRFDLKTRQLAAFLFLLQRGLSTGITIYAPAIILSTVLGWSVNLTCVSIGGLVILYTVVGGTRAVSQTQKHQMVVMMAGMVVAFVVIVLRLPPGLSFGHAVHIAGTLGKMNVVDFSPSLGSRYTFWSGLTGGFFLAMAYFGTDQSQVQRYLSGTSITASRLGLLFNGLFKVPMQFLILFVGVMVFVFHQFQPPPIFFNEPQLARAHATPQAPALRALEAADRAAFARKREAIEALDAALDGGAPDQIAQAERRVRDGQAASAELRRQAKQLIARALPGTDTKDADYVFLSFVMHNLPRGLIGLLLAVVFCAAMSSTASELSALGSTTVVDFYRRSFRKTADDAHYLRAAKLFTAAWGALAVLFATFAALVDNLIQAVNILGSLFYGTILGMFLVAFFLRRVRATPVFVAAILSEALVVVVFLRTSVGFLWYNVIGCAALVLLALALSGRSRGAQDSASSAPPAMSGSLT
jgi:SSS family solute:Na+ symporter